jgi:hypothetical protein
MDMVMPHLLPSRLRNVTDMETLPLMRTNPLMMMLMMPASTDMVMISQLLLPLPLLLPQLRTKGLWVLRTNFWCKDEKNNVHNGNKLKRVQQNRSVNKLGYEPTHSKSACVESCRSCGDGDAPEQPRRQRHRCPGGVPKCSIESTTEVQWVLA